MTTYPRHTRFIWTILLGLSVLIFATTLSAKDSKELDVVLLMDSSGSMKKSDPNNLRKPAAKLFISLLESKDRASVVSFSDDGYPVAYLTSVKEKNNQAKLFAAVDKVSTKGVYTNLSGAIDAALRVFNRNKAENRNRTIVLMSDGKADLGNQTKTKALTDKLLTEQIPMLKKLGIELHTIAFTDQSDKSLLNDIAIQTGGQFYMAESDKQLHDVYTAIFEQHKAPNIVPFNGEKFLLDKSVSEVTVIGSKDTPNTKLSLVSPKGDVYTIDSLPAEVTWFESKQFDLITIANPVDGEWKLQSSAGKNKAYVITDLELAVDTEPRQADVGEGVMIKAWLTDKGVKTTKEEIYSNLTVELNVVTPESEAHDLDMEPYSKYKDEPESAGIFASHIAFPSAGRFQLNITFSGKTFTRKRTAYINVGAPAAQAETAKPQAEQAPAHEEKVADKEEHEVAQKDKHQPPASTNHENASGEHKPHKEPKTEIHHDKIAENPIKPQIDLPAITGTTKEKSASRSSAKAKKPKNAKNKASKSKGHKDDKKAGDSEHGKPKEHNEDSGMMTAVYIFVGINLFLAIIGGIAFFVIRRKKAKARAENGDEENKDQNKPAAAKAKANGDDGVNSEAA